MSSNRHAHATTCPLCLGTVERIARRPMDRLLDRLRGLFVRRRPLYRYQCWAVDCGWQGRLARRSKTRNPYDGDGSKRHVLPASG